MTPASIARVKALFADFIRSDYMTNWTAENTDSGGYSRNADKRDRFARCHDAAEHGADGMTHAEVIADWRDAISACLSRRSNPVERLENAIYAHIDSVELWHETNGSLHQEIG